MNRFCQKQKCVFIIFLFSLAIFSINNFCLSTPSQQDYSPERIVLTLTENPATSQAVTWRTVSEVSNPQAQFTQATGFTDFSKDAEGVDASMEIVKLDNEKIVYQYSVVFKSLKPNTLYAYRVGDGEHWSEWNQFRTANDTFEPFKFIYFGDVQNEIKSMCSRVFRDAFTRVPDANFWLIAGDLVNHGNSDEEWGEFFYSLGWIPGMTPLLLLPGNHEYLTYTIVDKKIRKLNDLWRPQFTLPENGPDGLEETAYFIYYQGVRFVMLNGNEKLEEQAKWLDSVLAKDPQRWTIVSIHQPFYSTGIDRDNPHLRELFIPIFDKYSVDLVLQGHDHTYGRTYKLRNGIKVDDNEKGTVYIVSVSGPKVYTTNKRFEDLMVKISTGRQLYQVISLDENLLKYESFTATGELYDSFELQK
jgi:hypothetical protein